MAQDLDQLKFFLRDYVENITRKSKGRFYVCPICKSGEGPNETGAFSVEDDGRRWKCFACDKGGDIYDLYAELNHCTPSKATQAIIAQYGKGGTGRDFKPVKQRASSEEPAKQPRSYAAEIAAFAAALKGSEGESYLQGRGLTLETMQRFNLGYNAARCTVTIPYNAAGTYYGQRSVNPDAERKHDNLTGVTMPIFNTAALYSAGVCFIVESPLCAISIAQEGGTAAAISGTGGAERLKAQFKKKPPPSEAVFILCLDNDESGRKATDKIGRALEEIGVFCVNGTAAIMGTEKDTANADFRKDPNDVLQKSGADALREAIAETIEATIKARNVVAQEAEEERAQRTGAGMVDAFLKAIQTDKYKPMPTGISDIDKALCGGFTRQQVVMLGAAPGVGKTALAQWIFEGMAQRGETSCVYLNLEMSREQILARSISRIAARNGNKIRALEVMQGYKWTDKQRVAVIEAAQEYAENIAPRMIYNPDGITANLDIILQYIEREAQQAKEAQIPAPVVVLDYLQLVSGQPREDAAAVIKRAVAGLKGYAVRHDTIVFVIIAHNRQSNTSGSVSMESGRDTSAIEYSADIQLALAFTACLKRKGQTPKSPDDLSIDEQREITLRIVKGRFGGRGTDVDLRFDGETMTYTQLKRIDEQDTGQHARKRY